jgi:hypothetical protein
MLNSQEFEQRNDAIRALFSAFDKTCKNESILFIAQKTEGCAIVKFLDACKQIESYNELPKNIAREIIHLAGSQNSEAAEACPKCGVYKDGVREWDYVPGLQKHYSSEGDIYQRVGYTRPCECQSGRNIKNQWAAQGITLNTARPVAELSKIGSNSLDWFDK